MGGKAKLGSMQLVSQGEVSLVHLWMPLAWQMILPGAGKKKQSRERYLLHLAIGDAFPISEASALLLMKLIFGLLCCFGLETDNLS